jgi:hypothetical protein
MIYCFGKSLVWSRKTKGLNIGPCRTPYFISPQCEILREVTKTERDKIQLNFISMDEWSRHFKDLFTIEQEEEKPIINATTDENVDTLTVEKLIEAMKCSKNKETRGCDKINLELKK